MSNWRSGPPDFSFEASLATLRQESQNLLLLLQDSQTLNNQIKARCRANKTTWGPIVTHRNERYWPEFLYDMETLAIPNIAALMCEIEQNVLPALHGLVLEAHALRLNAKDMKRKYPVAVHHPILLKIGFKGLGYEMLTRHLIWMIQRSLKKCKRRLRSEKASNRRT